jgi:hypothetical protein
MSADDAAICDALGLAVRLVELAEMTGGTVAELRRELEETWLECAFADDSGENMKLLERNTASGEVALVAELEHAKSELVRAEDAAQAAIAAAHANVVLAQSRVDDHRRGAIRQAAQAWRAHARALRERAAATSDDETVVTSVYVIRPGLTDVREPRLRYRRDLLTEQADEADSRAQLYENYLLRGRDSAILQQVTAES